MNVTGALSPLTLVGKGIVRKGMTVIVVATFTVGGVALLLGVVPELMF